MESQARTHDLLALSDIHLGCDLKPRTPFGGEGREALDRLLVEFLDHHSAHSSRGPKARGGSSSLLDEGSAAPSNGWRLLLNGDIFDFVAVTAVPGNSATFEMSREERLYGLAPEEEKSV